VHELSTHVAQAPVGCVSVTCVPGGHDGPLKGKPFDPPGELPLLLLLPHASMAPTPTARRKRKILEEVTVRSYSDPHILTRADRPLTRDCVAGPP
jgi:hypothetical protein